MAYAVSPRVGDLTPVAPTPDEWLPLEADDWLPNPKGPRRPDPVIQRKAGPPVGANVGFEFPGIAEDNGFVPPDPNGAVGGTQFVETVNTEWAIYDKSTGSLLWGPSDIRQLFTNLGGVCAGGASTAEADPIVLYDKLANVWVVSELVFRYDLTGNVTDSQECVGVSTTSDATGIYYIYGFDFGGLSGGPYLNDYPKLAVWPDAYYYSANVFQNYNVNSRVGTLAGAEAVALDRSEMLAGDSSVTYVYFSPDSSAFSFLPSDLDGAALPPAGSPNYFVALSPYPSPNTLGVWQFHVDFSNTSSSTFTGPVLVQGVAAFNEGCGSECVPQANTSQLLDALGDRAMHRLAYRNFGAHESLVVDHSVDVGKGQTGVRWYEIQSPGNNPFVYQQSTFAPDANYRWMGSMAMDRSGDIAVGYSLSNSNLFPDIYFTGRLATDPLGTLENEQSLYLGAGPQTGSSRWGDYTSMSVDPSDDCTFWYTNEYLSSGGSWQSEVANLKFPSCAAGLAKSPTLTVDFFGDGEGEPAVWRPSNGTWYVHSNSRSGGNEQKVWGLPGDVPEAADYDGDGKSDFALWRPSSGTWYIIPSSNPNNPIITQWGLPDDVPVPADYDGDGIADVAVWRPSTGTWYIVPSTGGGTIKQVWGLPGDVPVIGDYDGDGKADYAVFRPSNYTWYVILSSTGKSLQKAWGLPGDIPVEGDYDGDGKTDYAIWRPSTATWWILLSSSGTTVQQQWGQTGDIPVVGDYNGDGKNDYAIWRPSNATWYVTYSSGGGFTTQWGETGDVPATHLPSMIRRDKHIANFDGDRKADLGVFQPSNGTWYVIDSSTGISVTQSWGLNGDIVVPGDYDGDGKTDYAVWRPSNQTWYVILSSSGKNVTQLWGASGDIPLPGDYDGDGKTDYAIWRPTTGTWWVLLSSTAKVVSQPLGLSGDIPVPADYDGDGKTDYAVWQPSNGTWYVILSSTGKTVTQVWGLSGDIPVPGDYDGDTKADYTVFRPSNGTWYTLQSSNGKMITTPFGQNGDIPVAKDYDGDEKTDIAVWRPSNATWYILQSSNGKMTITQWGASGDVPVNEPTGY